MSRTKDLEKEAVRPRIKIQKESLGEEKEKGEGDAGKGGMYCSDGVPNRARLKTLAEECGRECPGPIGYRNFS